MLTNYHLLCHAHICQSLKLFLCRKHFPFNSSLWSIAAFAYFQYHSEWKLSLIQNQTYSQNVMPVCSSLSHLLGWNLWMHHTDTCYMSWWVCWWQCAAAMDQCEGGKGTLCLRALWASADKGINKKKGWVNVILQTWGWQLRMNNHFFGFKRFFKIPCAGLDLDKSIIIFSLAASVEVLFLIHIDLGVHVLRLQKTWLLSDKSM